MYDLTIALPFNLDFNNGKTRLRDTMLLQSQTGDKLHNITDSHIFITDIHQWKGLVKAIWSDPLSSHKSIHATKPLSMCITCVPLFICLIVYARLCTLWLTVCSLTVEATKTSTSQKRLGLIDGRMDTRNACLHRFLRQRTKQQHSSGNVLIILF